MSDDTDLIISISTDIAAMRRSLRRLESDVNNSTNRVVSRFDRMNQGIARAGADLHRKIAGAFAVAAATKGAQELIDAATGIQNALKVAGLEGDNLKKVYGELYASAQRNSTPIASLAALYGKLSLSSKSLGANQADLTKFTDTVSLALRVGGTDAVAASGALLQLSQSLGSIMVRAEEFNSIIEGAPTILLAAAAGIEEAGGSVDKLRRLMLAGELSNKGFFRGIIAGTAMLESKVAGSEKTISQRFVNMKNALVDAAGRFNESTEAANTFGGVVDGLTTSIEQVNFDKLITQLKNVSDEFRAGLKTATEWADTISQATGMDAVGEYLTGGTGHVELFGGALGITSRKGVQKRIDNAFDMPSQDNGALSADSIREAAKRSGAGPAPAAKAPRLPPAAGVKTIKLADYLVDGDGKAKAKERTTDDPFAESLAAVRDRTAALAQEINMVGLSEREQDKRRMALELEQKALADVREEARKSGATDLEAIRLSKDKIAAIEATVAANADMAQSLRDVHAAQEKAQAAANDFYGDMKSGIVGAIMQTNTLKDAINNLFKKLAENSLNNVFGQIVGSKDGNAPDFLAKLFGAKSSTTASPAVVASQAAMSAPVGSMSAYRDAIASIESKGSGDYSAMGPITASGDRAYGRYQVMGANIPSWTKEATGSAMTPNQFMADTSLQDKVFDQQFGKSISKYGNPQDAASVWFTGRPLAQGAGASDILGTTGSQYTDKFTKSLGTMSDATGTAAKGLDTLGGGFGKIGSSLSGAFPVAPTAPTVGGGIGGWLSSLFGGGAFNPIGAQATLAASGGITGLFARGGKVDGPGTGTSDSILARLSNGEFVVNAKATAKNRAFLESMNRGLPAFALGGIVPGGPTVTGPRTPVLNARAQAPAANSNAPVPLNVNVVGANGDAHVRALVNQGVQQALADREKQMVRSGVRTQQQTYASFKG